MILVEVLINLELRSLCVSLPETSQNERCYPVAVGKSHTPTPTGIFYVESVEPRPDLISFKTGANLGQGILGAVGIFLGENPNIPGTALAIHGTNQPGLIGLPVSHGCVRMTNKDIIHLVNNYVFSEVKIK